MRNVAPKLLALLEAYEGARRETGGAALPSAEVLRPLSEGAQSEYFSLSGTMDEREGLRLLYTGLS